MSLAIFILVIIIGNLINILFKIKKPINTLIGSFILWPLFFSILSLFTRNFYVVSVSFFALLTVGFMYLIKSKNYLNILIVSIFILLSIYLLKFVVQFGGDLDSKNYLIAMTRVNFDSWGILYDKVIGIPGLAEHFYFHRLPFVAFGWIHNIFLVPLNPSVSYIQSLLFYIVGIYILSKILRPISKLDKDKLARYFGLIPSLLLAIGVAGPYMFYSSNWGQMNQSYTFLLSVITIYLFTNNDVENSVLIVLSSVISFLVFLSYTEFYFVWLILYFVLVCSKIKYSRAKIFTYLFISPLSVLVALLPNLNRYLNYFFGQINVNLVVNLIENPKIKYGLIYYFFQFFSPTDYFGVITGKLPEIGNVVMSVAPIIFFITMYKFLIKKKNIGGKSSVFSLALGAVVFMLIYLYIIDRSVVVNYQIFKYSGWTSWMVLLIFIVILQKHNPKQPLYHFLTVLILIVISSRICNLIGLYMRTRVNASSVIISRAYLPIKYQGKTCVVAYDKNYINMAITLGNYLSERNNCEYKNIDSSTEE